MMVNHTDQTDILRVVFDALPSLIFIVDQDVRIQDYNTAASALLQTDRKSVLKHRAGEILHCVHSQDVPEGCGRAPFCKNCVVRNSVTESFQGKRIVRRRTRIELNQQGKKTEIYALITASPFSFHGKSLSLTATKSLDGHSSHGYWKKMLG
jgi:PAS domain-containing protein